MISRHLCMDGWLCRKHSLAFNQVAPLPRVPSTIIVVRRREFIVVAIARWSGVLPKDDNRDAERVDRERGSKTLSERSSSLNLRRRIQEYELHLSDDDYCTQYSSYRLSRYALAFDWLGKVLPGTWFKDRQIQPALGDDAFIFLLCSIQQAKEPGDAMEW